MSEVFSLLSLHLMVSMPNPKLHVKTPLSIGVRLNLFFLVSYLKRRRFPMRNIESDNRGFPRSHTYAGIISTWCELRSLHEEEQNIVSDKGNQEVRTS